MTVLFWAGHNGIGVIYGENQLARLCHLETIYRENNLNGQKDNDTENVLKQLKIGKSADAYHIHAKHLIHAWERLAVYYQYYGRLQ